MAVDAVIILAAGEGTRMKSTLPKVLHEIAGRSLLGHVVAATVALDCSQIRIVVGSGREQVEAHISQLNSGESSAISLPGLSSKKVTTHFQETRRGTGDAVSYALTEYEGSGDLLILAGDTPLLTAATLQSFVSAHENSNAKASILSVKVDNPFGYGRIIRNGDGSFSKIVEERDATPEEKLIQEINSGVYIISAHSLREGLTKISTNNSQGELYLTDVFAIINNELGAGSINIFVASDSNEFLGINDRVQLASLSALYQKRRNEDLMRSGVTIIESETTWIGPDVVCAKDVTILPGTSIMGKSSLASGVRVGPRTTLNNCSVDEGAEIRESTVSDSHIGAESTVGPYSFIRPGTVLARKAKVGAYVEIKASTIGEGSKVPHLSYVGDAEIGVGTNIGAATIFVNYDGVDKHKSKIGNHVRIGSDSMIVAPVEVGDGAYTAAGSVITENVPAGAIAVARARQRNILGWVLRKRKGSSSEEAARKAGATE